VPLAQTAPALQVRRRVEQPAVGPGTDHTLCLQLLYVIMMYIVSLALVSRTREPTLTIPIQAVYPIAVSIRSTNVYEEKSMGASDISGPNTHTEAELRRLLTTGVYDEDFDDDPDEMEARFDKSHSATAYIGYHARKQLAFDLWWLALAVWLICIVERNRIGSPNWP
jgi:hypothetical protein